MIKKPFQFGKITLPNNIFYAPLAGCSDYPFRKMSSLYGPGLIYCEMVKMDALVRHDPGTFHMLDYDKSMHPIGAQLCGSKPELAGKAARIIQDLGFDVIDLNCGCPVDKVTKDGSGSGLLKTPQLIGEIISNIVAAVSLPVTLKIRAGWDEGNINAAEITRIAEAAGATAICVHGRTRVQAYRGPANWDWIRESKQAAKNILVIGNGDLFDPESVKKMFETTHCDAVLIARGTMGQPWIVQDIINHMEGAKVDERSREELFSGLMKHFSYMKSYLSDRQACIEMRRVGCWYIKDVEGASPIRQQISHATTLGEIEEVIENLKNRN
jgi:nifR3 family TIM-barrel protein